MAVHSAGLTCQHMRNNAHRCTQALPSHTNEQCMAMMLPSLPQSWPGSTGCATAKWPLPCTDEALLGDQLPHLEDLGHKEEDAGSKGRR